MKKGVSDKIKQRIEAIEGRTANEALRIIYFIDMKSFRFICEKWSINTRTLMRLFRDFGFEPRKGSEAIKTQWIGNEERRKYAAKKLSETRKLHPHPCLGISRPDASERMKANNPMFNLEIRNKANQKTIDTYNKEPQRMGQFHKKLTPYEQSVFDFFTYKGIKCIGNELIGKRFVDIYLPEFKIAIECVNSSRFPLSYDRHCHIKEQGVKVVYCTNYFIKKSDFDILYDYIINPDIVRSFPSLQSQEAVVFGRRNGIIFDTDFDKFTYKTINMDKLNVMFLTIATDNKFGTS